MTTADRQAGYTEGYTAHRRYTAHRDAKVDQILTAWTDPAAEKVRGLVVKHWPRLAQAINELEEVEEP